MEKPRVARTSVKPPIEESEESEEKSVLSVYKAMLELVEDIHKVSLTLDNDEGLARVLSDIGLVKASVSAAIERVEMEIQMAADVKRYEEGERNG